MEGKTAMELFEATKEKHRDLGYARVIVANQFEDNIAQAMVEITAKYVKGKIVEQFAVVFYSDGEEKIISVTEFNNQKCKDQSYFEAIGDSSEVIINADYKYVHSSALGGYLANELMKLECVYVYPIYVYKVELKIDGDRHLLTAYRVNLVTLAESTVMQVELVAQIEEE